VKFISQNNFHGILCGSSECSLETELVALALIGKTQKMWELWIRGKQCLTRKVMENSLAGRGVWVGII